MEEVNIGLLTIKVIVGFATLFFIIIITGRTSIYQLTPFHLVSNKGDDKLFKTLSLLIPEEELKPELKSIKGGYKDIDVVTVSEQLNQKGILEDVGGVTYLTQLAGSVPTTANTIYYCDLVKSKALRRRGIEAAKNIRYLSEVQEFEYDETFLTEVENQALKIRSMAFSLLASTLGSFSKMYIKY